MGFNLDQDHRRMVGESLRRYLDDGGGKVSIGAAGDRKLDLTQEQVITLLPYYFGQPEMVRTYPKGTMRAMKRAARGERTPVELEQVIEEAVPEIIPIPETEPDPIAEPFGKVDRPRKTKRSRGRS